MKKLFAVLFVAAALVAGAFAQEAESVFPSGSWVDEKWNGEWVLGVDGSIQLKDSNTGALIYNFTDDKVTEKKIEPGLDGVTLSFYCKETERYYYFKKGLSFDSNLNLRINPDWEELDYQTTIMFKSISLE